MNTKQTNKIKSLMKIMLSLKFKPYYGFTQGHSYLTDKKVADLGLILKKNDEEINVIYEKIFKDNR